MATRWWPDYIYCHSLHGVAILILVIERDIPWAASQFQLASFDPSATLVPNTT